MDVQHSHTRAPVGRTYLLPGRGRHCGGSQGIGVITVVHLHDSRCFHFVQPLLYKMLFFSPQSFSETCSTIYAVVVVPPRAWYRQVVDAVACFSAWGKFAPTRQRKDEEVDFFYIYIQMLLPSSHAAGSFLLAVTRGHSFP